MLAFVRRPLVIVVSVLILVAAVSGVIWYQMTPHTENDCLRKALTMPHKTNAEIDATVRWQNACIERVS